GISYESKSAGYDGDFSFLCQSGCLRKTEYFILYSVPFHVRRIVANALDIPKSKVRVVKPRIGGGFGAKQTAVSEIYPAVVTWMTGKPSMIIYSRYESQIASSPRHEMELQVTIGCYEEGIFKAIDVYTLSNTGAYG